MMPHHDSLHPPSPDAIERWLAGESSPDEAALVLAWIEADAMRQQTAADVKALDATMDSDESSVRPVNVDALWQRLEARVLEPRGSEPHAAISIPTPRPASARLTPSGWRRLPNVSRWGVAGAGLTLGAILVGLAIQHRVFPHRTPETIRTFTTRSGQQTTVQLPGGTTVQLAPATSARVILDGSIRLEIEGEAYVCVAANAKTPFTVQTNNAIARVLGTRFSVRQYPQESTSRIVVEDGRVALVRRDARRDSMSTSPSEPSSQDVVLSANMLAQVGDSGMSVTSGVDATTLTGWTRGALVFDRMTLSRVLAELSRAYGVSLRVEDSVLAKRVLLMKVTVQEQPLSHVLATIGKVTDAEYRWEGDEIVFVPGDHMRAVPARHPIPQPERTYGK